MLNRRGRNSSGVSLVEWAASVVFGLPLVMAMLYAVLEFDYFFTIRTNLEAAARRASQALLNDWNINNNMTTISSLGALPATMKDASGNTVPEAFDIKTADGHYFVNATAPQYIVTWSPGQPIAGTSPQQYAPRTVTVTVVYPTGGSAAYNILPFPWPDPLNLKNQMINQINTTATFASQI
ncbi:MAG TPA: TadE family protein [Candidatus Obscuribacterales bacterium]